MKKNLITIAMLLISSVCSQAQFIHSIEFNNGFTINSVVNKSSQYLNTYEKYSYGLASAINIKYMNHNYWNLSSQLAYMEVGQKTEQEGTEAITHIQQTYYDIFYFNLISFNTLFEIKYPNKYISPSLKFGPRIDYTYVDISDFKQLYTFNYGFALGGGLNYQFKGHFNLHADYIYNWFAKDLVTVTYNTSGGSHTINSPAISIKRNMSIMLGFGYKF